MRMTCGSRDDVIHVHVSVAIRAHAVHAGGWPHVDDQLIRAQHRLVIVCGIDAQSRFLSNARIASLPALNSKIFPYPRGVLLQDVIVLSAADSLATRPARECASVRDARKRQSRTCYTSRSCQFADGHTLTTPRHFFRVRGMDFQPQPLVFREGVQVREPRQSVSRASANRRPSSWKACRIFLRRAGIVKFPRAGRDPRSR